MHLLFPSLTGLIDFRGLEKSFLTFISYHTFRKRSTLYKVHCSVMKQASWTNQKKKRRLVAVMKRHGVVV